MLSVREARVSLRPSLDHTHTYSTHKPSHTRTHEGWRPSAHTACRVLSMSVGCSQPAREGVKKGRQRARGGGGGGGGGEMRETLETYTHTHTHGWMDGHAMHLCSKVDSVGPLQLRRLAHKTDGSVCTGASTTQPPCLVSPTPRTQKTHPSIHAFTTTNETNHTD